MKWLCWGLCILFSAVTMACHEGTSEKKRPVIDQVKRVIARKTGKNPYSDSESWKFAVESQLAQMGSKNWIIVTESSFPALNQSQIKQIYTNADIPSACDYVLSSMEKTENLTPVVYMTRELQAVGNDAAPGVDAFAKSVSKSLRGHEVVRLDQQSLIALIEEASRHYRILVIKTNQQMPYGSVFFELKPGYWDDAAEQAMRHRLQQESLNKVVP